MLAWVIVGLFVGLADDKKQLAAFSILINLIETMCMMIYSLSFQIKMTISYFIAKQDTVLVKRLIRWAFYSTNIVVLAEAVVSCLLLVLIAKWEGQDKQAISEYLIWAIPFLVVSLVLEGVTFVTLFLMKAFNYIWVLLVMNLLTMTLNIGVSYFLTVFKKMGFKGAIIAYVSIILIEGLTGIVWVRCGLDVSQDI